MVDIALKSYLADVHELRASLQDAIAEDDAGGGIDGDTFMADLLAEAQALAAQRST